MNLFILFTFAGWTFDFSIGFKRTLNVAVKSHRDFGYGGVYGTFNDNGDFVPEGVMQEDPNSE
jgi:hypothetical protein